MRGVRKVSSDGGFTLVEVMVSLAVLGTFMAAAGPFFVSSIRVMSRQSASQAAVQLADSALEQIHSVRGSSLASGRSQSESDKMWAAAPAKVKAYANFMKVFGDKDAASGLGADAPIPTSAQTMKVEQSTYRRTIYIGICDVNVGRGQSGDCLSPDYATPNSDSTKDLQFFRAVVLVTWPDSNCAKDTSEEGTCSYVASTLVARGTEPTFDIHRPAPLIKTVPVALYQNVVSDAMFEASGGQLPNTWSVVGTMPPGITLSASGYLVGKPTTLGSWSVSVTVKDSVGRNDTETMTISVISPPILTQPAAAKNHVGEPVSQTLAATGGVAPYTYKVTGLPTGLTATTAGVISGTVTTAGTYPVTGVVSDANGQTSTKTWTHTVYPVVTLAPIPDQSKSLGGSVAVKADGNGGGAALTYTVTGLPTGMQLNANNGTMNGKPLVPGRYLPAVTVADGLGGTGGTATQQFEIVVTTTNQLIFTSPGFTAADQTSTAGTPASVSFQTNGAQLGLSPVLTASGMPPGMTLNALTGTISGTPTTPGVYTVTMVATNVLPSQVSNLTFLWTVK